MVSQKISESAFRTSPEARQERVEKSEQQEYQTDIDFLEFRKNFFSVRFIALSQVKQCKI
ncbi:hypothetical protein HQ29_08270 [Porphyromonas canoris]|uniref:Uncharacterized protein n=1 Tax=Porphyromonas canoris TaxID=36875 RepID=A0ABR4XN31_9PORP|nr:hypothetical protein HQ29_08270 [Porphyromonas canoris]KGN70749.1 hypothetical protein JT26_01960 [Porphyromonas sp. COT-108 OH1349]KGN93092.1 hypothetical protein HQ43_02605 [Porphyromonas canoris]